MMGKPAFNTVQDDEGVVHIEGPSIAVNAALCGNNSDMVEVQAPITCRACTAIVGWVRTHHVAGERT